MSRAGLRAGSPEGWVARSRGPFLGVYLSAESAGVDGRITPHIFGVRVTERKQLPYYALDVPPETALLAAPAARNRVHPPRPLDLECLRAERLAPLHLRRKRGGTAFGQAGAQQAAPAPEDARGGT